MSTHEGNTFTKPLPVATTDQRHLQYVLQKYAETEFLTMQKQPNVRKSYLRGSSNMKRVHIHNLMSDTLFYNKMSVLMNQDIHVINIAINICNLLYLLYFVWSLCQMNCRVSTATSLCISHLSNEMTLSIYSGVSAVQR